MARPSESCEKRCGKSVTAHGSTPSSPSTQEITWREERLVVGNKDEQPARRRKGIQYISDMYNII